MAATRGEATICISAPPERVYELVADISQMGRWSPECYRCEWLDPAGRPKVGARFRGHNRMGLWRWSTTAEVVAAEPGREFAFTIVKGQRESTRWRYRFEPSGAGTSVTESYEFVWAPLYIRIGDLVMARDNQLRAGMIHTLERIKAAAEAPIV